MTYNDSLLYLMRDLLPNGLLGLAIAGLLAAFMAGMAANISAFNTVFSYDLWERLRRQGPRRPYYLASAASRRSAPSSSRSSPRPWPSNSRNIMNYLQTLFGFFNAPLFATFILGMFWKRMTPTAGWVGLVAGTLVGGRGRVPQRGRPRLAEHRGDPGRRPGRRVRGRRRGVRGRRGAQHRGVAGDPAEAGRGAHGPGLLRDPEEDLVDGREASRTPGTGAPCRSPASRWSWSSP